MSNYDANGGSVSRRSPIHIGNRRELTTPLYQEKLEAKSWPIYQMTQFTQSCEQIDGTTKRESRPD